MKFIKRKTFLGVRSTLNALDKNLSGLPKCLQRMNEWHAYLRINYNSNIFITVTIFGLNVELGWIKEHLLSATWLL